MPQTLQKTLIALDAVTETTTSQAIPLKGVGKVTLFYTRANHGSGSSAFKVTVSADDVTYVDYNKCIDNVTTTPLTRITTKTLSTDTTATVTMALAADGDCFSSMKVTATETTDGTHTAKVVLEYL